MGVTMNRNLLLTTWIAVACAVTLTSCQSSGPSDKAGGDTIVLRLASIDDVNDNGQSFGPQAFLDNIDSLSDGKIQVEVTPLSSKIKINVHPF